MQTQRVLAITALLLSACADGIVEPSIPNRGAPTFARNPASSPGTPTSSSSCITKAAGTSKAGDINDKNRCIAPGSIRIVKNAVGEVGTFSFTTSTNLDASGSLSLQATLANSYSASKTYSNLAPATYTVTEAAQSAPWEFTSLTCTGNTNSTITTTGSSGREASIALAEGENITCTYLNTYRAPGSITIVKATNDTDGSFTFTPSSNLSATTFTLSPASANSYSDTRTFSSLVPGVTYTVTEDAQSAPWEFTSLTCDGGTTSTITTTGSGGRQASIALADGEDITCTFTNTYREPGSITVVKTTNDAAGSFTFTPSANLLNSTFTLAPASGNSYTASRTFSNLHPGATYTVTEGAQSAPWAFTSLTCDGETNSTITTTGSSGRQASIVLADGEDITCTWTNTYSPAPSVQWNFSALASASYGRSVHFAWMDPGYGMGCYASEVEYAYAGGSPPSPLTRYTDYASIWGAQSVCATAGQNAAWDDPLPPNNGNDYYVRVRVQTGSSSTLPGITISGDNGATCTGWTWNSGLGQMKWCRLPNGGTTTITGTIP